MAIIQLSLLDIVSDKSSTPKKMRKVKDFTGKTRVCRVLHLGAGRQSSTLAEMIVEGELPRVDLVIFADTGNEPFWVYQQVEYLTARLASVGIPLIIVRKRDDLTIVTELMLDSYARFASMPFYTETQYGNKKRHGRLKRQCTNEWKIQPSEKFVRNWLLEHGYAKVNTRGAVIVNHKVYVEDWYGISADEPWRLKERGQNWRKTVYPLNDQQMRVSHCIAWLEARGLPVPKKSSCLVCAYHGDDFWLDLYWNYPDLWEQVCVFDDWMRSDDAKKFRQFKGLRKKCYLHRSCKPLREVIHELEAESKRRLAQEGAGFALEILETCSTDGGFTCMS